MRWHLLARRQIPWVSDAILCEKAYGEPDCGLGLRHDALFYWAPSQGRTEVDFLLQRPGEFVAVEVKAKETLERRDFAGLDAIGELTGIRRRLVVYLGERPFATPEGIEVLPVSAFLAELESGTI